jgi:hypothetical protein
MSGRSRLGYQWPDDQDAMAQLGDAAAIDWERRHCHMIPVRHTRTVKCQRSIEKRTNATLVLDRGIRETFSSVNCKYHWSMLKTKNEEDVG